MLRGKLKLNRRGFLTAASQLAAAAAIDPLVCRAALPKSMPWDKDGSHGRPVAPRSIYSIHQLSEQAVLDTYEQILLEACSNAAPEWKTADFDASAGLWGDGASSGNGGIRTIVSVLLACATLIRYGHLDQATSNDLIAKSKAAVRFTTETHRTGTALCSDGKKWGATPGFGPESWQSGMWTGTLAWASWLIWDRLGAELQQGLEQVIAWECDILSHRPPPNGLWLDTKAEENGWEVPCLVMSTLMFPTHPHVSDWQQTAYRYMMNTLCTDADTRDTSISDGRPLNEWIKGANLQPDYTLENHGIFHPAYVGCSSYFLTQAVMYYTYAHRAVPQAATHHLLDTWRMFQTIILPWGESACPQGMDWELHGLPYINLYASLATRWRDPLAAHLEQCNLQYLRAWQVMCHGSLATPGSRFGIVRHAINAEQASYGFLAHKIFGSAVEAMSSRTAAEQENGVRDYPYVDFIAHRTLDKFVSFSWKNKIMGLLIPTAQGHEGNPDFTAPIQDGFVGSFEIDFLPESNGENKPVVVEHQRLETPDGFETTGTVLSHSGRLKQTIKMTSLGDRFVVYEDHVIAAEPVTITGERGLPVGIENDEITGGTRVLTCQQSQIVFDWQRTQGSVPISGSWVNVDGRLGAAVLSGSGICYVQAAGYSRGISICSDILFGSFSNQSRRFRTGEAVAHRLAVFAVEVTPKETAAFAKSCSIREVGHEEGDQRILRFRAPEGHWREVKLLPVSPANLPALRSSGT
jgi:hypothetical protein